MIRPRQLPFQPYKLARSSDPRTSHEAARSAKELRTRQHATIICALEAAGGPLSAEQIADRVGVMDMVQVGRRLGEMVAAEMIEDDMTYHRNRSGRRARRVRLCRR